MPPKLFRFTHFPKNTSATSLESHTFKTKDLKPFRFIHFQERVVGGGAGASPSSRHSPLDMNHCFLLSPLYSALTRFPLLNSFRICTYKKGGGGGGYLFHESPITGRVADHWRPKRVILWPDLGKEHGS